MEPEESLEKQFKPIVNPLKKLAAEMVKRIEGRKILNIDWI